MDPIQDGLSDLNAAAWAISKGHTLLDVKPLSSVKALYVFADSDAVRKDLIDFYTGIGNNCNARKFIEALRACRDMRSNVVGSSSTYEVPERRTNGTHASR